MVLTCRWFAVVGALLLGACAGRPTPASTPSVPTVAEPIARHPPPPSMRPRVSDLLTFETPSDELFVTAEPSAPRVTTGASAGGGDASLSLTPGTQRLVVKLPSLLVGRTFPGDWTMLGASFHSDRAMTVTARYDVDGRAVLSRAVAVPAGAWTEVWLDLTDAPALSSSHDGVGVLVFELGGAGAASVRCDDVVLVDNRETLVDAADAGGWTVTRRGFRVTAERRGERPVSFSLDARPGDPRAWRVEEATPLRVRFASAGPVKRLTAYADGRALWDGQFKPVDPRAATSDRRAQAAAHASPGELAVAVEQGRVNRDTPGDADNDGYNEQLGAYQVQASGPRVEVSLAPRGAPLPRPVLQVAGLPWGRVLVTMEGQLVETTARLPDGQLLVILPTTLARATTVNVRVH